jgi:PIN domain nuclease of toxin-antitoxin system
MRLLLDTHALMWWVSSSLLIEPAHVYALQGLPDVHRDPFDRIMIAQAIVEDLAFVSADRVLSGYPVRQVW